MDAYQNLISGDKRSMVTQGNCSEWLLPCYKYYTHNRPKNQDAAVILYNKTRRYLFSTTVFACSRRLIGGFIFVIVKHYSDRQI